MILEIPILTSSYSSITVDLDEVTYMLVFRWNTRETSWLTERGYELMPVIQQELEL